MTTLSWNCYGLGTPWGFQFLKEIILQKKPDFVFLSEILCKQNTGERLQDAINFEGMLTVETQGHSGGITMLWRYKDEVILSSFNKNHIDLKIKNKGGNELYSEPDRRKRAETWSMLQTLARDNLLPWCLIGDFNNVMSKDDKKGGMPYQNLIQRFRSVVDDCNLIDVDIQGHPFTWERGAGTSDWIEVRLDRALVNVSFLNVFTNAKLLNLEASTSEHFPILLDLHQASKEIQPRKFRFESAWLREPMCHQIVEEVWSGNTTCSLFKKIEECSNILSVWGQEITGNFKKRIQK